MTVKLLAGNNGKTSETEPNERTALVRLSGEECFSMGFCPHELTLQSRKTRLLLGSIFAALEAVGGCRRDGHYVEVTCRPLRSGGCRFLLHFTDTPSGRLFRFAGEDDLLDALCQLQKRGECDPSRLAITHSGGDCQIYIPADVTLSEGAAAILMEYAG